MALTVFSPNTLIKSADMNANLSGLSDGTNDATANSLQTFRDEALYDFVVSGCVWTADSAGVNRNGSMTAGVVCINGKRVAVSAVTAHNFDASKDTYVTIDDTGAVSYGTPVTNNSASPALPANSLLNAIVVAGATFITNAASINQGDPGALLPIASSVAYAVTDSIGNLICNRSATPSVIGYREYATSQGSVTAEVDLTGLSAVPFIAPGNRNVTAFLQMADTVSNTLNDRITARIKESTTVLNLGRINQAGATNGQTFNVGYKGRPSAGLHTYKASIQRDVGAGTVTVNNAATNKTYIEIKLD